MLLHILRIGSGRLHLVLYCKVFRCLVNLVNPYNVPVQERSGLLRAYHIHVAWSASVQRIPSVPICGPQYLITPMSWS